MALLLLTGAQGFCQDTKPAATLSSAEQTDASPQHKGRKGFVIGLGLGPGQTGLSSWIDESFPNYQGTKPTRFPSFGFSINSDFRIGFAPSDRLLICWANEVAWYSDAPLFIHPYPDSQSHSDDIVWANSVGTACVSYFFRPCAPSVYVFGGPGFAWLSAPSEGSSSSAGFGFTVGGGVEFARHWCVDVSITCGAPRVAGVNIRTASFRVMINWLGY